MSEESSELRQQLRDLADEQGRQIEIVLAERGPLIRGTFGSRSRVCGASNCKCAQGERHESKYLSASEAGRTRQVHVPAGDELAVREGVERARRFRAAHARLAEITKRQLELVDRLGRSLLSPYPKDAPFAAPHHRGPPPKRGRPARR